MAAVPAPPSAPSPAPSPAPNPAPVPATLPAASDCALAHGSPWQAEFLPDAPAPGSPWAEVPALTLPAGKHGADLATWVGVSRQGQPQWRLDVDAAAGHSCFRELCCVGACVFVGVGESLFVLHGASGDVQHWPMDGYFGSLYPCHDLPGLDAGVLVASATSLLRLDNNGQALWHTQGLGWDGVLVHYVRQGVIHGSGECDPPGGWVDFRLDMHTGLRLDTPP